MNEKLAVSIGDTFLGTGHFLLQMGGVGRLVSVLVKNLIMLAGLALIFVIVIAGFTMVSSAGEAQQFERARNTLTTAIIGFIIVVAAWFIVRIIETSTGVSILQ